MEFLAHRGLWFQKDERNSLDALFKGLDEGYGLETDIRDINQELVISHDMPELGKSINLNELFIYYRENNLTSTLALNIKCDGLQEILNQRLINYGITNYFVFDMSVPDTLGYFKKDMRTFVRRSDVEYHPELALNAHGIWLDELKGPWIDADLILKLANETDYVCIVSPELHGREYQGQWDAIMKAMDQGCPSGKLMLCTDKPREAEEFFK